MLRSITNVRPTGPGRLAFEVTGGDGGPERIVLRVDGKTIVFRLTVAPDEVRTVTVRYDEPGVRRVVVSAPESGLEVSPPLFDAEGYGMQFESPRPKDIVYCEACGEWHEQGEPC